MHEQAKSIGGQPIQGSVNLSRRRFVQALTVGAAVSVAMPQICLASSALERRLRFYHVRTGERLSIVYAENGKYVPEALIKIAFFLRDHRSGDVHQIDPPLLDLLHDLVSMTRQNATFDVVSAYRSPETNAMLRKRIKRVAKKSLHMQGRAVDVKLGKLDAQTLRGAAVKLARGGVGYYSQSGFLHLDTGPFRTWS